MNKKTETFNIRCTKKQKEDILKKSGKAGVSASKYMLGKALNGTSRVRSTKADMAHCNAQFQTELNKLEKMVVETENPVLIECVKALQEAEDKRWKL